MASIVLDGKLVSEKIKAHIRRKLENSPQKPTLATILVGDNPASHTYVSMKRKSCESVGMLSKYIQLDANTTTQQLLDTIRTLNEDPTVHGILLQHPSPSQIDERLAFDSIDPKKDVDGVSSMHFGNLANSSPCYYPCTPYGMVLLLQEYGISVAGKKSCVVGRSPILGKPMASLLTNLNSTVTLCHSQTKDLEGECKRSEIIVGALGKPEFIKGSWIQEGAILLDAGYNVGNIGDIDLKEGSKHSSYHTPVPGGVGPMTIATLLLQTYYSFTNSYSPKIDEVTKWE